MATKDILLLIDQVKSPSPAADVAIELARLADAHLTGLALAIDPIVPGFVVAPIPVELIEAARDDAMKAANVAVARFEEQARKADISRETRIAEVLMGGIPEAFVGAARLTDLVIIGQDDPDHSEPLRDVLIETALFDGIAPTLIVPYITKVPLATNKVLVAWDGSKPAVRAIRAALPLLSAGALITVVIVGSKTDLPGEPGADVATWLSRHGFQVSVTTLPAGSVGVADAILNYAADNAFELVVMGAYGHSRMREFVFGGATRDILRSMTVPVLMAH